MLVIPPKICVGQAVALTVLPGLLWKRADAPIEGNKPFVEIATLENVAPVAGRRLQASLCVGQREIL